MCMSHGALKSINNNNNNNLEVANTLVKVFTKIHIIVNVQSCYSKILIKGEIENAAIF